MRFGPPRHKRLYPRGFRRPCSYCGFKTHLQTTVKNTEVMRYAYWVPCCKSCWLKSCNRGPLHPAAPGGLVGRP